MPEVMFSDIADFDLERQQLARRRKLAEELLRTRNPENGVSFAPNGGVIFSPSATPGGALANGVDAIRGMFESQSLDREERDLAAREAKAANDVLSSIPQQGDPNRQAALLSAGNALPSLRNSISALLAADERAREAELNRIEKGEQQAADRQIREMDILDRSENRAADRVARATPTTHISIQQGGGRSGGVKAPSGYRYNEDGTALEPIPGGPKDPNAKPAGEGKPLSAPQEKAALELGSEYNAIRNLASTFKDEYSGDLRSSLQREFGKAAGGMAPEATQAMTRWWSDQAYMDELPKRHELFGAALTATEQRSWKDAAINPSLAPSVIRDRLATRQRIMEDAASRMKASAVAGGKSGKQFDAATGGVRSQPQQSATPARRKWNAAKGDFE